MYKIEKNIEYPRNKDRKYPFSVMKVGDSFFVPSADIKNRGIIANNAYNYAKRTGKKFRTQTTKDGGVRCWRIL